MAISRTSFKAGQVTNPGGRPKLDRTVQELCRKHTAEAIAALVDVPKTGAEDSDRITAATYLLDRGYGKPRVEVSATPEGESRIERIVFDLLCPRRDSLTCRAIF